VSAMQVCGVEMIQTIVTDDSADRAVVEDFERQGVRVVMV